MARKKVIVGLSGGVDSAVAAYVLKKQGYDVHAVFMKNFSEQVRGSACPWREDRLEAYRVASFLDIPIATWDFENQYADKVLRYMFAEYERGRTPNPDIMCNKEIKFKAFLERARHEGAEYIATGHYAAIRRDQDGVHLLKGVDRRKDQSYFLSALNQQQLTRVLFPLAGLTKARVRALARRIGLPNADRPDSQGICFVGPVDMKSFLMHRIRPKRGEIVTVKGEVLGHHDGIMYYTIGQRRGISVGGGPALYVIGKDRKRNRLIVGSRRAAAGRASAALMQGWHWIGKKHAFPLRCRVKIRYRQKDEPATLKKTSGRNVRVIFRRAQRAVAPGQTVAAYLGSELIGSGVID